VITFQFLDWPLQSHLEVEVRTDREMYYEETFKFNSRSPAKAINRVYYDEGMSLDRAV